MKKHVISSPSPDRFSMLHHCLNKYPVPSVGVLDEDLSHDANQFAVLDNGATAHVCVK